MAVVWGRANSLNVHKVLWALEEVGIAFERKEAGGAFGVVDTAEYATLNPNRMVPVLQDGDAVIWESNAIVRYLAARYGAGTLWDPDPVRRAIADQWMDWQQTTVVAELGTVFLQIVRTPPEKRDMALVLATAGRLEQRIALLESHLADRAFVAGDRLTMGDIPLGAALWRWSNLPLIERPPTPAIDAWLARLGERPGFARHVARPLT